MTKRDTIAKIKKDIKEMAFINHADTKEKCLAFTYTNGDYLVIKGSEEEMATLEVLSGYILANVDNHDSICLDIIKNKRDAFTTILDRVIQKELILMQYDPMYNIKKF